MPTLTISRVIGFLVILVAVISMLVPTVPEIAWQLALAGIGVALVLQ